MRLTKPMKAQIIDHVTAKLTGDKVEKAKQRLTEIAQEAVSKRYPKKVWEWMRAAPEGGVVKLSSAVLRYPGSERQVSHKLTNHRHFYGIRLSITKDTEVLAKDQNIYQNPVDIPKNRLAEVEGILKGLDKLQAEIELAKQQVTSALSSINTVKQLQDNYPSLTQYLPSHASESKSLVLTDDQLKKYLP